MTHINAYFADVEEAKQRVLVAQAELAAAEARLADKKREDGFQEPEPVQLKKVEPVEEPEDEQPARVPVTRKK
jgi:hypothetical protein